LRVDSISSDVVGVGAALSIGHATYYPLGGGFRWNVRGNWALSYANSDEHSNTAFEVTTPGNIVGMPAHYLWFPRGFLIGGPGAHKKVESGAAAPSSGAYNQGDIVFNAAPTAGGPMGWMCVAGGSPGTWKAMPSLAA
jgi:hypothetical protein